MSRDIQLIERLHKLFALRKVVNCLTASEERNFQICEIQQNKPVCIVADPSASGFRIDNPREKRIHVFATDNCFFHEKDGKRCDCIVFDDTSLCFVELKLNVITHRQATQKAQDGREQLGATIKFFRDSLDNDFMEFDLEDYIVMQDRIRPARNAQRLEVFVNFLRTYGVPLTELSDEEQKVF
jgi:hypothetical protein